ncbi:MAG: hypothetical protein ACM3SS_06875, partial [Rhodospirillaceae bacterium]
MGDKSRGLYHKFNVERTDGSSAPGGKHHGCDYFVLDMTHDAFAKAALTAYADACEKEYPLLADDLRARYNLSPAPQGSVVVPEEPDAVRVDSGFDYDAALKAHIPTACRSTSTTSRSSASGLARGISRRLREHSVAYSPRRCYHWAALPKQAAGDKGSSHHLCHKARHDALTSCAGFYFCSSSD